MASNYEQVINDLHNADNLTADHKLLGVCARAAAAIEELEKEKAIANRKLDSALKKMPKCGKWIRIDKHTIQCPLCHRYLDLRGVNAGRGDANYCLNCGAEMEVQDGQK